ncbi:unnamed protein product [Meloidogyne enterolobii]|uniref:Uncharacterized protein n=1 Tax=Meloidogyne enterolobii TaxID=390850 RepID=A0ACB0XKH7_MELEN
MFNNFINSCSILILIFTDIFLSVYGADVTPAQALKFVNSKMSKSNQVNKKPHINTMSKKSVNVYQVKSGIYAYASGLAVDTDGSDSDPDPDHQDETAWKDSNGKSLGAHRVPYYVLGDKCHEKTKPCPYFFYKEHNIAGLQFALFFFKGKAIGAFLGTPKVILKLTPQTTIRENSEKPQSKLPNYSKSTVVAQMGVWIRVLLWLFSQEIIGW